jgi:hypothetical protein
MSQDFTLSQELGCVEDRFLSLASDKAWFARQRATRWAERAAILERDAERAKRKPSGAFKAQLVTEVLDHSRAQTEAKNPMALLELARQVDEEHRPTPVVPDPRKEP